MGSGKSKAGSPKDKEDSGKSKEVSAKKKSEAKNPLILRCHRLMEAFAKSDDERDFYLDRREGFLVYVDLDKMHDELHTLEEELKKNSERYCLIPKFTFYETKKIMEGFVNEKVYDIDTKEKLLDIIQSKEARENFLEFIFDHHSELEKWQQYYQERSRIRIIEWLRNNHFHFVFEEDLEFPRQIIEKLKENLFQTKVSKDLAAARKTLVIKAKTYYSNEALNPRPKRGRPPKQTIKQEAEPQITSDIYTTVPPMVRPFLFTPDIISNSAVTFSSKFETEEQLLASRRSQSILNADFNLQDIQQKLASLRTLSSGWMHKEKEPGATDNGVESPDVPVFGKWSDDDEDDDEEEEKGGDDKEKKVKKKPAKKKPSPPQSKGTVSPVQKQQKQPPKKKAVSPTKKSGAAAPAKKGGASTSGKGDSSDKSSKRPPIKRIIPKAGSSKKK